MAGATTLQQVRELQDRASRAIARAKAVRENASHQVERLTGIAMDGVTVAGTALGCGVLTGRYEGLDVLGVSVDAVLAVGLHAAGLLVEDEHTARTLHSAGHGALAAWSHTYGLGLGRSWALENKGSAAQQTAALPANTSVVPVRT